jgi:hypothetical protein
VDGEPVELGARAFDVLLALIEAAGTVLNKDELMARVWPDRVVEENNLQVQIAALRRALADHRESFGPLPDAVISLRAQSTAARRRIRAGVRRLLPSRICLRCCQSSSAATLTS